MLRYSHQSSKLNRHKETWKFVEQARGEKEVGIMSNTLVIPVVPRKGTTVLVLGLPKRCPLCMFVGWRASLRELRGVFCFLSLLRRSFSLMRYLEEWIMY